MADILFHTVQQILLCLFLGQTGDLLQGLQLLGLDGLCLSLGFGDFLELFGQLLLLVFKGFGLLIQGGFLLL